MEQITGKTRTVGKRLIELCLNRDLIKDSDADDYGYRVAMVIEDPYAYPSLVSRYGVYRNRPPQSAEDLPWSVLLHRTQEVFDFDEQDWGKKVWFCVRPENTSGETGPWGPLFWTVIP
jgi:hypothetical protein